MDEKKYNVAVSYASEQRSYVERFVKRLHSLKLQVYYDRDEQAQMVGKILDQELHKIYIQQSRHCVLFLSNEYIKNQLPATSRRLSCLKPFSKMALCIFSNLTMLHYRG